MGALIIGRSTVLLLLLLAGCYSPWPTLMMIIVLTNGWLVLGKSTAIAHVTRRWWDGPWGWCAVEWSTGEALDCANLPRPFAIDSLLIICNVVIWAIGLFWPNSAIYYME